MLPSFPSQNTSLKTRKFIFPHITNNSVKCTLHRFQFRTKTKLKSGKEKYSNTILCIAEILSQGSLQLQMHRWTTAPTDHPSAPPRAKTSSLLEKQHFIHLHLPHFQSPYNRPRIQGKQLPLERSHKYWGS